MHLNFNQAISKEKPYTYKNKSKYKTSQALNINKVPRANILPVEPGRRFSGCLTFYRNSLTSAYKSIFDFFLVRMNLPYIKLKNNTVAKAIGCHPRTVQRATAHFKKDGIIFKFQMNTYSVNNFKVNVSKSSSFALFLNRQSKDVQKAYIQTGQIITKKNIKIANESNVAQSYSNINYIYQTTHKPITRARVREFTHNFASNGVIFKKVNQDSQSIRKSKVVEMLKDIQRQWLMSHRSDPRAKEILERPEIKTELFTPLICSIKSLLKLDDRETVKLIAIPDSALKYAHDSIKPILNGSKPLKKSVDDRMGWFMGIVKRFCNENKLTMDWKWYYTVSDILGLKPIESDEPSISLGVNPIAVKPAKQYKTHSEDPIKPVLSIEDKILHIKSEIERWKLYLSDPVKYFEVEIFRELSIRTAENSLAHLTIELIQLQEAH